MFRKMTKTELRDSNLSEKSERYLDTSTGEVISKRQYQKQQRGVTYTQFKKEITAGTRQYKRTPGVRAKIRNTKKRGKTSRYDSLTAKKVMALIKRNKGKNVVFMVSINLDAEDYPDEAIKYGSTNGNATITIMSDRTPEAALERFPKVSYEYEEENFPEGPDDEKEPLTYNVIIRQPKKH